MFRFLFRLLRVSAALPPVLLIGCVATPSAIDEARRGGDLAELHTQLAVAYLEQGEYEFARERIDRALAMRPDYPGAHNALGSWYRHFDRLEKAEWHYRRAIAVNPVYAEAYHDLGVLLCITGRESDALAYFAKAIATSRAQEREMALSNAGDCAYLAGDLPKAETYLRRALSRNMKLSGPLLTMAALSLSKGEGLSARRYLQRYLGIDGHSPRSLWLGIRIERLLGNRNAVLSYALLLKTHYPNSRETRLFRKSEFRTFEIHDQNL
uniref:Type IV pilus assembly protein PilF n=1 Tax=Candidatus Kentrum sp. MB TaxID=2138164 RepID=A0A451BF75_9GAMM|nr:MAG: type IV pilus assembly protein PilF [Candidatus Kentron sp. MB]VFK76930.1 MAG: type IV pilus assembly protein PilF [Candidatus Kentron sp. MB]